MYLQSLASAFPAARYTQKESWKALVDGNALEPLSRKARRILDVVLNGDSGIETRHFAIVPPKLFTLNAEELNNAFEAEAPKLATAALEKACLPLGVKPEEIDALFICTCTGYLCPGVTSHVAERFGLREDAYLNDVTGLGCGAAIPTLHAAECFLAAHPDALVATVAVEICSAAFYVDDDTGVLVSACLFGDGASASLWRSRGTTDQWRAHNFQSLHVPSEREKIRFVNAGGKLRNKLDRAVPQVAAAAVEKLFARRSIDPDRIIAHTGGRDVIDELEKTLPAKYPLDETREALRLYGNLSSPSVLLSLESRLAKNLDDHHLWLTSFGAGFCAYSCELTKG